MLRGVHVVFHPLLAPMGDRVGRFAKGSDDYGAVEAHNLDEIGENKKYEE